MMDFINVKAVTIPEGNVNEITIDGVPVWSAREYEWDYGWDYTMGTPDISLWDYPIGGGTASFEGDEGLYLTATSSNYAGLRFKDYLAWLGQKAIYELEVKVISTTSNGFRIICSSGINGVSDGNGLQVTINGSYLNVLKATESISTITADAPITYNEWHKIRLELNKDVNANKVYLDGALIATVSNADLSTQYAVSVWCLVQYGTAYVKSVRYRKED